MYEEKEIGQKILIKSCGDVAADIDSLLKKLEEKYKNRCQEPAWSIEAPFWKEILHTLSESDEGIGFNYRFDTVLGVGGAGAVFRIIDCNLFQDLNPSNPSSLSDKLRRSYRALKVPRPHFEKAPTLADSLRSEISRLISLSHPNVVSLYAKGQIPLTLQSGVTTWPWFIMGYMHNATDLQQICEESPPDLSTLIRFLYDVANGLQYIHHNGLIHCDIKPANIFLSSTPDSRSPERAVLADFGYSKYVAHTKGETTVGFTDYFAHPDLQYGSVMSSQGSRSFNKLPRLNIRAAFDLFALGMSIHYLLEKFYRRYSTYSKYSYEIKYLKLCAARLLDGLNHQKAITFGHLPYHCFSDNGKPQDQDFIEGISYKSIDDFVLDLQKLLGQYSPEFSVPELLGTRRENIQVSDSAPVVYTNRLRKIVDHPLIRRLATARQLGLLSMVYPGGTHSRLEHSLGTFGITARYIQSLYNDTLNPLFRQLVTPKYMKATLLAALLHDIGQYPLAHDLEDVSNIFFSHEQFGNMLLTKKNPLQVQARLFNDLKDEKAHLTENLNDILNEEWGVSLNDVLKILTAKSSEDKRERQIGSHIDRLCKSLIDGPIDADKLDYLDRDSRHCNVKYGFGIDRHRLFKCLTVANINIKDNHLLLVMGVHEKGRISAESILFARYAMLTQIYWHHTMRAIKALLHTAASEFLNKINDTNFYSMRDSFFRCALFEEAISDSEWNSTLANAEAVSSIDSSDLRILGWLWHHTSEIGKKSIEHIINRNMLKRILTVYRAELTERQRRVLDKVYTPEMYRDRVAFRESIEKAILVRLQKEKYPSSLLETQGFTVERWDNRLKKGNILRCVADYPAPRKGASFGLQVIGQWGERPPKEGVEEGPSGPTEQNPRIIPLDHFSDGMKELEKSIACFRIYWHPEELEILRNTLKDEEIKNVILGEIENFRPTGS